MDAFQIIVSTRMKGNAVARLLTELGTPVRYITLRRGEFILADKYGVKYLSSGQFIEAIKNRSIYREILEMKREYANPIILIEGKDPFHDPALSLATVHGVLLFASLLNRVPILVTADDMETAQMIFMMAAQTGNGLEWKNTLVSPADSETKSEDDRHADPRVNIIARLPEIGPSLAEGLLKHFGSLSKLFAAGIGDLRKVEGIGPKRAEKIFAFLNETKAA